MSPSVHTPPAGRALRLAPLGLALLLLSGGCDFEEPERYVNTDVHPPVMGTLAFHEFREGHHIAGRVRLNVSAAEGTEWAHHAVLLVDGRRVGEDSGRPLEVDLYTERFEEGAHEITVLLSASPDGIDPESGLLNLGELGGGTQLWQTTLVFDQSPPSPVPVDSVVWVEGRGHVFWHRPPGVNENVRAYEVWRLDRGFRRQAGTVPGLDSTFLGDVDYEVPRVAGLEIGYEIVADNGRSEEGRSYGPTFRVHRAPPIAAFNTRVLTRESYAVATHVPSGMALIYDYNQTTAQDSLYVVSLAEGAVVQRRAIEQAFPDSGPAGPPGSADVPGLVLTPDGREVMVIEPARTPSQGVRSRVTVYDVGTLAEVRSVELDLEAAGILHPRAHAVADGDGRVYLADGDPYGSEDSYHIYGFDTATGAPILKLGITPAVRGLRVDPQGRYLTGWSYGVAHNDTRPNEVFRIDLQAASPGVVARRSFEAGRDISGLHTASDGALFVEFGYGGVIEELEPTTLETVRTTPIPEGYGVAILGVDATSLYVRAPDPYGDDPFVKGRVEEYDRATGMRLGYWLYYNTVDHLGLAAGGEMLTITQGERVVEDEFLRGPRVNMLPRTWRR